MHGGSVATSNKGTPSTVTAEASRSGTGPGGVLAAEPHPHLWGRAGGLAEMPPPPKKFHPKASFASSTEHSP